MQIKISEGFVKQQIQNAVKVGSDSQPIFHFELKNATSSPSDENIINSWILILSDAEFDGKDKRILEHLKIFRPTVTCGSESEIENLAHIWGLNAENHRRAAINVAHFTGGAVVMKLDSPKNLVTDGNIIAYVDSDETDFKKIAKYASITSPLIASLVIFGDNNLQLEIAGQ